MKCSVAVVVLLAMVTYAVAQSEDTTAASTTTTTEATTTSTASTTTTAASTTTTAASSTSSSTTQASTTTQNSSTTTEGSTTPTVNTCTQAGKYPKTSETCSNEFIMCIPNFKGEFWQHTWRCPPTLIYSDKYKKCLLPRKVGCPRPTPPSFF